MNRLLAITFVIAIATIGHAREISPDSDYRNLGDSALLERLLTGGLVLVFRHGQTGPNSERSDAVSGRKSHFGTALEKHVAYFDCERQRNLSDAGRAELRRIGDAMRGIGFVVGEVYASPMCRTRETAWLLVGQVMARDALIGPDNEARRRLVTTEPVDGRNRLLVTHGYVVGSMVLNIDNLARDRQLPRGHAYVLEPLDGGTFRELAILGPDDWTRLADLAEPKVN
jgi:broad specificity phosphatase PhoE